MCADLGWCTFLFLEDAMSKMVNCLKGVKLCLHKRLVSSILCCVMLIGIILSTPLSVLAADTSDLAFSVSGRNATITACSTSAEGELIIPYYYQRTSQRVVSIADYAFSYCNLLSAVRISKYVTSIGVGAFYGCSGLELIYIPSSVTSIDVEAFRGCSALKDVYYSGTQEAWETSVSVSSDNECLTNARIHYGVTESRWLTHFSDFVTVEEPTCVDLGVRKSTCNCGYENVEYIDISGHSFPDEWTVDDAATCTSEGSQSKKCVNCDETQYEVIPATGHNYVNITCSYCGDVLSSDEYLKFTLNEDGLSYSLSECTIDPIDITIPEVYNGLPVTRIGDGAFINCIKLKRVNIPESVTTIGYAAFALCISLENVVIPDNISIIGDMAFYQCTAIKNVVIPESVVSIGASVFDNCTALEDMYFEHSKEALNDMGILVGDENTADYYIHFNVEVSNWHSHYGEPVVTEATCISAGVNKYSCSCGYEKTLVHTSAYGHSMPDYWSVVTEATCTEYGSLSKSCLRCGETETMERSPLGHSYSAWNIVAPATCTSDGYRFKECTRCGDEDDEVIAATGHKFNEDVCRNCGLVLAPEEYLIFELNPDGASYSVVDCPINPESIVIPAVYNGLPVTVIGENAFNGCGMKAVTIPASITRMDYNAFYNCNKLEAVYISDMSVWCGVNFYYETSNPLYNGADFYLDGELVTDLVIPADVSKIGSYAFCNCETIETVTIPSGLSEIEGQAFYGCREIERVYISDLASWCECDFSQCGTPLWYGAELYLDGELITDLTVPEGVEKIGDYAFYGCDHIQNISIPEGVNEIGDRAFADCRISRIEIPGSVSVLGEYLFSSCLGLDEIVFRDGATTVGDNAFRSCPGLKAVVIPATVKNINLYTFYGSENIIDIYYAGTSEDVSVFVDFETDDTEGVREKFRLHYGVEATDWQNHYGEPVVAEPTCMSGGETVWSCPCGHRITEYSDPNPFAHEYEITMTEPANGNMGSTVYRCACGETVTDNYIAYIDNNSDGEITVEDYQSLVNVVVANESFQSGTAYYNLIIRYDANCDGFVDALDAYLMNLVLNGHMQCWDVQQLVVGDYDLDGVAFTENDISEMRLMLADISSNVKWLTTAQKFTADINRNGKVDEDDLVLVNSRISA